MSDQMRRDKSAETNDVGKADVTLPNVSASSSIFTLNIAHHTPTPFMVKYGMMVLESVWPDDIGHPSDLTVKATYRLMSLAKAKQDLSQKARGHSLVARTEAERP